MIRRLLIIPLLLVLTAAPALAQGTDDFSRLGSAINREITLVENDGTVRRGVLKAVTDDEATVTFGAGVKGFPRQKILSVERMRDGIVDGAIKGAIFGALLGLATLGYPEGAPRAGVWIASIVVHSGIGLALDATLTHRETLYRSPPRPSMSLSFRF
jgi:hypothetical protein